MGGRTKAARSHVQRPDAEARPIDHLPPLRYHRKAAEEEVARNRLNSEPPLKAYRATLAITPQQCIAFEAAGLTIGEPESDMKKTKQVQEATKSDLTVDNTLRHSLRNVSYDTLEEVNTRFNEQTDKFSQENADKTIFSLGYPSAWRRCKQTDTASWETKS